MKKKWTGRVERSLRIYTNPRVTDGIYLHFSEILKKIKYYAPRIRGKVLDVGAGKAPYKPFFKNAKQYIKLDNFDYPGIDIKADVMKKIPLKNNDVDSVLCFQVLEHVKDPKKVVDEIYRVLKKDGCCLLTTHMAAPLHGEPYDYYRFTHYALRDLFKEFKHIEIKPHGGAALSIIQLLIWGFSETLPKPLALPIIIPLNIIGKISDKLFYTDVFTLNYSVFAIK